MSKDILHEIIANKRFEVDFQKRSIGIEQLEESVNLATPTRSLKKALAESAQGGIIAEFKRRSPSKGWINQEAHTPTLVAQYEANGAAGLSILTDEKYFGGSLRDLRNARPLTQLPILRKDFIIDEYQLYQSRIVGADAILLIASALSHSQCTDLAMQAHRLGLEVLLEIHHEEEIEYFSEHIDMIGVNNRNLGSFCTDIDNSFRLASMLPQHAIRVSESGISDAATIRQLQEVGYKGFLMGETFMKTDCPGLALGQLIAAI